MKNNKMKVCFVLDHRLMHYRIPFFQRLASEYDVYVISRGPILRGDFDFKQITARYTKIGSMEFVRVKYPEDFSVLVVMQNLRLIQYWLLPFMFWRRFAFVFWGIGVSSSGGLGKKRGLLTTIRDFVSSFSDGIGFYSNYPLPFYSEKTKKKAVVVGNTVESPLSENMSRRPKDCFLFIGSLDIRKGLPLLFECFRLYLSELADGSSVKLLRVVGDGPARGELEALASSLGIRGSVCFEGAVLDPKMKRQFFASAAAVISPLQAGLSVTESFSFGVPFVTHKTPISGGEYLSIAQGENGFLFETEEELVRVLVCLGMDSRERVQLGDKAYEFYINNLQMEQFVARFEKLISNSYDRFAGLVK